MHEWGERFETFVDAAMVPDETVGRDEIRAHLEGGTLVPSRFMYSSDSGAANWIRLCEDPMYPLHGETVGFWANAPGRQIAAKIHELLGADIDYVSLGPGAGEKDAKLIRHWLNLEMDVFYYPYDISRLLISKAVDTVRQFTPRDALDKLRVKAVLADFAQLNAVRMVFRHEESPKVIALLGSLGNLADDLQFLEKLKELLSAEDLLILEVRLQSDKERPTELTRGDAALRFDFGALESYLGLSFERKRMTVEREHNVSSIGHNDTITTVVGCSDIDYRGVLYPNVKLLYIHEYTEKIFLQALTDNGFEVLGQWPRVKGEKFLVCMVRLQR